MLVKKVGEMWRNIHPDEKAVSLITLALLVDISIVCLHLHSTLTFLLFAFIAYIYTRR